MVFLKNWDIVDGTSFLRLLFFPLFFWASQGRGGFWRLYPSPTATIILCPSTLPRVQDQGVVWTSIKDKDHVLMSMTGGLCSKHSIFPSCVSPLLLIQNASLLTLPVTKCVKIFPTLTCSNFIFWITLNPSSFYLPLYLLCPNSAHHYLPREALTMHYLDFSCLLPTHHPPKHPTHWPEWTTLSNTPISLPNPHSDWLKSFQLFLIVF